MNEALVCRPARRDELGRAADFWIAMFEEVGNFTERDFAPDWRARYESYFARRIAAGEAQIFLAFEGERLIGSAGALLADGYPTAIHGMQFGYIFGVRVEPDARGRGLATRLTREAIAFLRAQNCRRIALHASPAGRPIYEQIGFIPTNEMLLPKGVDSVA